MYRSTLDYATWRFNEPETRSPFIGLVLLAAGAIACAAGVWNLNWPQALVGLGVFGVGFVLYAGAWVWHRFVRHDYPWRYLY